MIGRHAVLAGSLACASCFSGGGTVGAVCERDGDCGPGQSCRHQICGHCGDSTAQRGEVCFDDPVRSVVADAPPIVRVTEDNGDNDADLVVAVPGQPMVTILAGTDGEFGSPEDIALPGPVFDLEVVDLDEDGALDIAAAIEGTEVAVVFGNGHEVQTYDIAIEATEVAFGFRPDEPVVAAADDQEVAFFSIDGRTLSGIRYVALGGVTRMSNGSAIDGDEFDDFVAVIGADDELVVLHGEEELASIGATISTADEPVDVLVTDISGDGIDDIAVANLGAQSITTFVGDGEGAFERDEDILLESGPLGVTAIDLTRDGARDLLVVREGSRSVTVLVARGGEFPWATLAAAELEGADILAADLGGDALTDVLVVGRARGEVSLLEASP